MTTKMTTKTMPNIDADQTNADWIKTRSWDIRRDDQELVTTAEELEQAIAPMTVEHFLTLPAARAMPQALKDELGL